MPPERFTSCSTSSPRLKARTPSDCRGGPDRVRSLDTSHFLPCAAWVRNYRGLQTRSDYERHRRIVRGRYQVAAVQRTRWFRRTSMEIKALGYIGIQSSQIDQWS